MSKGFIQFQTKYQGKLAEWSDVFCEVYCNLYLGLVQNALHNRFRYRPVYFTVSSFISRKKGSKYVMVRTFLKTTSYSGLRSCMPTLYSALMPQTRSNLCSSVV